MKSEACFPRSLVTRNERGSSTVEYVLLASLLAMSVMMVVQLMTYNMTRQMRTASNAIGNAGSWCGGVPC